MKKIILCLLITVSSQAQIIDLKIIAKIESNNDSLALNKLDGGSRGLYQIHPNCLKEYNKITKSLYNLDDLYKKSVNEKIAKWYIEKRIPELLKYYKYRLTKNNILICYNAGIGYLVKKRYIPKTTLNYISKYDSLCQKK